MRKTPNDSNTCTILCPTPDSVNPYKRTFALSATPNSTPREGPHATRAWRNAHAAISRADGHDARGRKPRPYGNSAIHTALTPPTR